MGNGEWGMDGKKKNKVVCLRNGMAWRGSPDICSWPFVKINKHIWNKK